MRNWSTHWRRHRGRLRSRCAPPCPLHPAPCTQTPQPHPPPPQHAANESLQEAFLAEQSARSGLQTALDAEVEENCRLQAVAGELQGALEDEVGNPET